MLLTFTLLHKYINIKHIHVCLFDTVYISCLKQGLNADYELTAKQGADTMAYIALLEEKLRPALVGTKEPYL